MSDVNPLFYIIFVICLLLAAFFCSAETAFIGLQRLRLQHLIRTGHKSAKMAALIVQKPERFLSTVLFGINLFETAVATIGTIIAVSFWGENLGAVLATIIVTIVTLVMAELIPKSLAARHAERLALAYARPIEVISIIFYPIVFILSRIGLSVTRLAEDENSAVRATISEAEFHTAIEIGEEEGTVEEGAAEMLHKVFEFADRPAREVMVPRPDVIAIEEGAKIADFLSLYTKYPLSRFPVYRGSMDSITGIISVKDVLMALAKGTSKQESLIDSLIRPAYFVPENKRINELFAEMRSKNYHLAVIVDEFGDTSGVVSLSGLIEEIVGPVGDELAGTGRDFEKINESTFQIDGTMRIEDVNEEMALDLPEGDYETVAGFILNLLGFIPKNGDQLRYKTLKIQIIAMRGLKIEKILVTKEKEKRVETKS